MSYDLCRKSPHIAQVPKLLDRIGATGALVCAVHCALLPAALALLPAVGIAVRLGERFEIGFVIYAALLGLYTLVRGYRQHRHIAGLGLFLAGLIALVAGIAIEHFDPSRVVHAIAMGSGGFLVGAAHLKNIRLSCVHCGHTN